MRDENFNRKNLTVWTVFTNQSDRYFIDLIKENYEDFYETIDGKIYSFNAVGNHRKQFVDGLRNA